MLIIGVDDAGRGPLIGPMVLAGVLVQKDKEKSLREIGARDSKLLSQKERVRLEKLIKDSVIAHKAVSISASEIDSSLLSGTNLNTLEAIKSAEVINFLNNKKDKIKVIVDCPSTNLAAWRKTLLKYITHADNLDVVCEHKADFNHPSVSAASILAKVLREEEVAKIREKYKEHGEIGSGYPADPTTKEFLKKKGKELENEGIFRKTWATYKTLFPEAQQKSLGDFK